MRLGVFKDWLNKVGQVFTRRGVDEELLEELEETLIAADVNVNAAQEILETLRSEAKAQRLREADDVRACLRELLKGWLGDPAPLMVSPTPPTVYLFVGVNGAGKTTSIAKTAHMLQRQGKRVLLAAGDTFRAAAIDQLQIWADRLLVRVRIQVAQVAVGQVEAELAFESARLLLQFACDARCPLALAVGQIQRKLRAHRTPSELVHRVGVYPLKGVGFFRGCGNLPLKYTEKIYPRTNKHKNHHHQAPSQPYTTPKKTPTTHSQHPNTRPTPHAPTPNHAAAHTQDTHQPRPTSHRRRTLTQPILTDQPP